MANTYYKYAEREADSYINWAEIGKSMSDMLANENKVREEKKAALDEASRQFGIELSKAPQGQSKLMNEWALKYAGDAQSARLMQDQLLKSGQLKLNDYLIMRQNVTDGTTQAFDLIKEYQTEFEDKWNRMKEDKSQDAEQWFMAEAEGFGNFNETQLYINPTDGKVNVAYKELGPDGVYRMSTNPNKFTDVNTLRNRIKGTFDKYDVDTNMETYVKGLGKELNALVIAKGTYGSTGLTSEILDITQRKNLPKDLQGIVMDFEQAETKALRGQLANPWNTSSILTNSLDIEPTTQKPYTFTWDETDAKNNPEKILMKNKSTGAPVPEFSAQQEQQALEYLRTQARLRYDKEEKLITTSQAQLQESSQWRQQKGATEKERMDAAGAWNQLYTGKTAAEKQAAADILLGTPIAIKNKLMEIDMSSPGKVRLVYEDPKNNRTINMFDADGNPISLYDFSSKGVELHEVTDRKRAMKAGGGDGKYGAINEEDWSGIKAFREGVNAPAAETTADYTENVVAETAGTKDIIIPDKATVTANNLAKKFKRLGFTFTAEEDDWGGTTDNIIITAKDGKTSGPIAVDNFDNLETINAFIEENYDPDAAAKVFKPKAKATTTVEEVAKGNAKNAATTKNLNATQRKSK